MEGWTIKTFTMAQVVVIPHSFAGVEMGRFFLDEATTP